MRFFGLHWLDAGLIILYFLLIFAIAVRINRRVRSTGEFFLAGRRMGRFYQFFLNFGTSTDASQAAGLTREIYRQGIAGMWIQYVVLFLTPFYWFTALLFRRVRLTTIGDFFHERYHSAGLAAAFALFMILMNTIGGAMGLIVSAKTFMALTPKPTAEYSPAEQQSVRQFHELQQLRRGYAEGNLSPESRERLQQLASLESAGKLNAFVSWTDPVVFYLIYAAGVCVYILLGGFEAAAVTDALQGILMVLFSLLLIPYGLQAVGGFSGLHEAVPEHMLRLFGAEALSEYAWYTIAAMALANLVSIVAVASSMQTCGSARDESTARFGLIGGLMFKRLMMIFWALAGLIALALFAGELSDPDLAWGHLTNRLLSPGLIGIMMIGVLAASMSSLDAAAMAVSALAVNQLYRPFFPDKSEAHYLLAGRVAIVVMICGSVAAALLISNLLELFKFLIAAPAIFGAAIWFGFLWRRVTRTAVITQVVLSFIIMALIPTIFQHWHVPRSWPGFHAQTQEQRVSISVAATQADVEAGRAERIGQAIEKQRLIHSYPIYYEKLARKNPQDPNSPLIGYGRFNAELWLLSLAGCDFSRMSKAGLVASRFLFDALFPFLVLFIVSYVTRPVDQKRLDRFFAKLHTPVQPTPQQDTAAIAANAADMARFEGSKLFPNTHWEIHKPSRQDYLGFFGTWVLVGLIIFLLWLMVSYH